MSYTDYNRRIVSLSEAAETVASGDVIWIGSTLSVPYAFLDKLACRYKNLKNITLLGNMFLTGHEIFCDTKYSDAFHVISIVGRQIMPKPMNNVRYIYFDGGSSFRQICEDYHINAMAVEVCPPESGDMCNFGAFGANLTGIVNTCAPIDKRIAVINDYQPKGGGKDSDYISLRDCDSICVSNHALFPLPSASR